VFNIQRSTPCQFGRTHGVLLAAAATSAMASEPRVPPLGFPPLTARARPAASPGAADPAVQTTPPLTRERQGAGRVSSHRLRRTSVADKAIEAKRLAQVSWTAFRRRANRCMPDVTITDALQRITGVQSIAMRASEPRWTFVLALKSEPMLNGEVFITPDQIDSSNPTSPRCLHFVQSGGRHQSRPLQARPRLAQRSLQSATPIAWDFAWIHVQLFRRRRARQHCQKNWTGGQRPHLIQRRRSLGLQVSVISRTPRGRHGGRA